MALLGSLIGNAMSDNPQSMGDVASNYFNNRLNQDMSQYLGVNANLTPQSTTINYNDQGQPDTVTTKHAVGEPDTSMNYNLAPPAAAPGQGIQSLGQVAPGQGVQMPQPMAQPQAQTQPTFNVGGAAPVTEQPAAPTAPVPAPQAEAEAQLPAQLAQSAQAAQAPTPPNIGTPPAPGAPTQLAGPMVAGAVPNAPSPTAQPNQAATWQTDLETAQSDPNKLWAFTQNSAYPEDVRKIAANLYAKHMDVQKQTDDTVKTLIRATQGDPKAQQNVITQLRSQGEDGSLLKAVLYSRLGLHDLAQQEQQKLGAGNKWGQVALNGESYSVERDANGMIRRALNSKGEAQDDNAIAQLQASGAPFGSHAFGFTGETGIVIDPNGAKAEVAKRTNAITGRSEYVYLTGPMKDQIYTGAAIPQPKSIGTAIAKKEGTEAVTLSYAPLLAASRAGAGYIGKFNAENNTHLALPMYGPNRGKLVDMNNGGQVITPDANGNFTPVQSSRVTPAPAPAAVATGAAPTAVTGGVNPTPGVQGTTAPPKIQPNETPAQFAARQKQWSEESAKQAADQAKLKSGLADYEANAENTMRTIKDVTNHPGFKISVGGSQPIGSLLSKVPGTEARDWQAKYNQLKGQEFLSAFNNLRGGGSISDTEGKAATNAMAALNDPGISEKEFIRNAKILEDTVKMGVNRRRVQAGLEPKYTDIGTTATTATHRFNPATGRIEAIQ